MRSVNSLCVYSMGAILRACAGPIVAKFTIFTALMVVILVGNCYATQIIDSFDRGVQYLMVIHDECSTAWAMNTGISTDHIMGGSRETKLECIAGDTTVKVDFSDSNILKFEEGSGAKAKLILTWDGDLTPGLNEYNLGINLKADGSTGLIAEIADIDNPIWFRVEVYTDEFNASFFESEMPGEPEGLGIHYVSFDGFTDWKGSGANFDAEIGAIRLIIDGTDYPGRDLSINYVATGVPEPTALMLFLYGSVGLGLGIWWRKK